MLKPLLRLKTSVAWTGQYTLGEQSQDGLKATARVDTASSPALPGTDRVYFMKVEGNKLTMKSPGANEPMTGITSALVIELVKADSGVARADPKQADKRVRGFCSTSMRRDTVQSG
jgi:hypothetical protein